MKSRNYDSKTLFNLKRSRFEIKSYNVESLLSERNQLYDKIQLLTDEAESYDKFIKKQTNENNILVQDLSEFKLSCELLSLQNSRLDNQNKILQAECCSLLDLVSKIGPSELYNLDSNDSVCTESVIEKIKDSVTRLCDDRNSLVCTKDTLHQELCLVKSSLRNANKTICKLNKQINDLNTEILDCKHGKRLRTSSIQTRPGSQLKEFVNTKIRRRPTSVPDTGAMKDYVKIESKFSYHHSVDDSTALALPQTDNGTISLSKFELSKLIESFTIISQSVKHLIDRAENMESITFQEIKFDSDSIKNGSDMQCQAEKYTEKLCNVLEELKNYLCKIKLQFNNMEDENKMLNSELKMLKYALTSRIELKKHRTDKKVKIDKNAEINRLNNEVTFLKQRISELEEAVESVRDEKRNLLGLLDSITSNEC